MVRHLIIPVVLFALVGCGDEDEDKNICENDDGCPAGQFCNYYGSCESECKKDDDCRSGKRCNVTNGKCLEVTTYTYKGCAVQCKNDNDCKGYVNAKCVFGSCRVGGCLSDSDCKDGKKCFKVNHLIGYKVGVCCFSKDYCNAKCSSDYQCSTFNYQVPGYGGSRCDKNSGFCYCVNNNDCHSYSVDSKCVKM